MTGAREPKGYDEVRAALLERGYLETPLERLFLGRGVRGQLVSALLAGLLAGPALGILLAGVLVLEARGTVPAWPDGVLYALLFAPVLGLIVALAEAAAGLAIRTLGRVRPGLSPRTAALAAGLAVAGALAAYLGLWWLRGGGTVGGRDLLGLVVLAGGAGFAGRVVSAAALIQAALATGRAPLRRRPRTVALLLAATLLVSAAVAGLAAWAAREPEGQPVVVRPGAPVRSMLVGWDGLSLELVRGLERQGVRFVPAAGAEAEIDPGAWDDPVVAWTTVATGSPPGVHGVTGMELTGLRGAAAPMPTGGLARGPLDLLARLWPLTRHVVHSGVRRTPAAWEITADARKTAVVGWWGTWPASPPGAVGGYVVSDGALAALQRGRGLDRAIHPASWGAARGPQWLESAGRGARAALAEDCADDAADPLCGIAREALVVDLFAINALADALRDPEVGAAFLYLPGLDIVRERGRSLRADPFALLAAVRRHAAAAAGALDALPDGSTMNAGFVALPGRAGHGEAGLLRIGRPAGAGGTPVGNRAGLAPALVPAAGAPDAGTPKVAAPEAPEAVVPTWLTAAGFPVDDRMTGRPLPALAGDGAREAAIRTRARPVATPPPPEALEGDVLERLRSLGYVR